MAAATKIHDRTTQDLPINAAISIAIVPDPYAQNGEKIKVIRSIRGDILATMHKNEQINDIQLAAGREWQFQYEQSEIGSIQAIDPTKEAVDGGRFREPLTDKQIKAFKILAEADRTLGLWGARLVRDMLGQRLSLGLAASHRGFSTERDVNYIGRRFRECLDALAVLWGYATPERGTIVQKRMAALGSVLI